MTAPPAAGLSFSEWAVIGLIAEGPTYGFALSREFAHGSSIGRIWTIPAPLVYRAISTLTGRGLVVEIGSAPGSGGPQRRLIEATPKGKEAVGTWLSEPVAHVRDARSELLVKLLLLDRSGADPLPLLRAQRTTLEPLLVAHREQLTRCTGFDAVLLRWRLYSAEAVIRLVAELIADHETS